MHHVIDMYAGKKAGGTAPGSMVMERTGAQILLDTLIAQGVDTLFGYPGGTVLDIFDALYERQEELRLILTAHEQGAAHAADGYARSTGKTGVVLATSGPGATNLVTGIATAYLDSVPLVAITGNVARSLSGSDGFQEVNITSVTKSIVKGNFVVRCTEDMAATVHDAIHLANSGRKRPVLIDIPKDVGAASIPYEKVEYPIEEPAAVISSEALEQAVAIIAEAKRPLIYAGGGVTFSDASDLLLAFSRKIGAPVCTSLMGLSSVPASYPLFLGLVGMHGAPTANKAVGECDVLIAVGARFSDRVAGNRQRFAEQAKRIQIDIDPSELSKNVKMDVSLAGDVCAILPLLLGRLPVLERLDWVHSLQRYKAYNALPTGLSEMLTPHDIIVGLRQVFGEEGIVVTDVGQHQMWTAQYYRFARPRSFLSSCGLGTMGYGMGAAIGAQIGNPGRPVALVSGDGSFHMNLNELATAVTYNLPIIILVFNNGVLGMVHQWQSLFYGDRFSHTILNRKTNYVALAEAFGAKGFTLTHKRDVRRVLEQALAVGGPCVINCVIDVAERVYPIIPPGMTAGDMIYSD